MTVRSLTQSLPISAVRSRLADSAGSLLETLFSRQPRRRKRTSSAPVQTELLERRSLLSATPLAHWKFDETSGANVIDSTATGADGTNYGATSVGGAIGRALHFDGVDDKVEFGTEASLGGISDFTVTAWIRTTASTAGTIIQQRDPAEFNGEYRLGTYPDGNLALWLFGDFDNQFLIGTQDPINDGAWHHVAAGREGRRGFIYVDGLLKAETFGPVRTLDASIRVGIGADIRDHVMFFEGSIDEVRIYASAVPANEILNQARIIVPQGMSGEQRPVFTWPKTPNAVAYSLWVERTGGAANPVIHESVPVNYFTAATDLGFGQFRTWVRATLNDGTRTAWVLQTFVINSQVALLPLAPQQNTHRPTVEWKPLPGAVRYDLWIDNLSTGQSQFVRDQNIAATSWTSLTDMPIGRYRVYIRGIDSSGAIALWSSGPTFEIAVAPTPMGPLNPTFERKPEFRWAAVTGAQRYEVAIRNVRTQTTVYYVRDLVGTTWIPPENLPVGVYQWWVRAIGSSKFASSWSAAVDISIGGETQFRTPVETGGNRPLLSWRPVTLSVSYWIWIDRVGVQSPYITSGVQNAEFRPGSPLPAGTYRAWVRSLGGSNEASPWSAPIEFTISS